LRTGRKTKADLSRFLLDDAAYFIDAASLAAIPHPATGGTNMERPKRLYLIAFAIGTALGCVVGLLCIN
jgi:hypothetical protein